MRVMLHKASCQWTSSHCCASSQHRGRYRIAQKSIVNEVHTKHTLPVKNFQPLHHRFGCNRLVVCKASCQCITCSCCAPSRPHGRYRRAQMTTVCTKHMLPQHRLTASLTKPCLQQRSAIKLYLHCFWDAGAKGVRQ